MKRIALILFALVLAACGDEQPHAPMQAQTPAQAASVPAAAPGAQTVVVNQAPQDSGIKDMLLGGALGYMLGSSGNRSAAVAPAPAPQVIERRVYVRERAPAPAAVAPAPAPVAQPAAPVAARPVVPAAPAASPKPFTYGAPPAPTPKVTYGTGFAAPKAAPTVTRTTPSFTSRPGAYSRR